jgi:hypothetical protein
LCRPVICDNFDVGLGSFEAGDEKINCVDGEVVSLCDCEEDSSGLRLGE